jgi:transcriptional regulator with XRE-family HTH domain
MTEAKRIVEVLKRALKARGITYAALGRRIGLSEPSVKRILSRGTLSLARLDAICAAIDLSVQEVARLAAAAGEGAPGERGAERLTEAQERALAADSELLACFHLLANGRTAREAGEQMGADERRLRRWLVRLDALGLLTLEPRLRVRLRVGPAIDWRADGPVRRLYEQQVREEFLRGASFAARGEVLQFRSAELSEAACRVLERRIARLVAEFVDLAELDRELPAREKRSTGLLVAFRPWVFSMFRGIVGARATIAAAHRL